MTENIEKECVVHGIKKSLSDAARHQAREVERTSLTAREVKFGD